MTTTPSSPARARWATVVGLVVFLGLTGTGAAHALWSAVVSHTTTLSAGSVSATLTGPGLTVADIQSSDWSTPTALTLTNTSAVEVNYTLATTTTGTLEPVKVALALWPRTADTCPSPPPSTATISTLKSPKLPPAAAIGAPGASTVICAATRITEQDMVGTAAQALTASPVLTATYATTAWVATTTGPAFTHTMAVAPAAPNVTCTNWNELTLLGSRPRGIQLNWDAVPGASGGYKAPTPASAPSTTRTLRLDNAGLAGSVSVTSVGATGDSAPAHVSTHTEGTLLYGRVLRCGSN